MLKVITTTIKLFIGILNSLSVYLSIKLCVLKSYLLLGNCIGNKGAFYSRNKVVVKVTSNNGSVRERVSRVVSTPGLSGFWLLYYTYLHLQNTILKAFFI